MFVEFCGGEAAESDEASAEREANGFPLLNRKTDFNFAI